MIVSRARVRSARLTRWTLVALWAGGVLTLSSGRFGSEQTGAVSLPWLDVLGRDLAMLVHVAIRKTAHLSEYLVLAVLTMRALRLTHAPTRATAMLAVGVCVAVALVDEAHQAMVPGRNGSLADVLLDGTGAAVGALLATSSDRLGGAVAPLQPT